MPIYSKWELDPTLTFKSSNSLHDIVGQDLCPQQEVVQIFHKGGALKA